MKEPHTRPRFGPWGMTNIIHAQELLDGDQGAFVKITKTIPVVACLHILLCGTSISVPASTE
jgi:hypothetical protein